MEFTLEHIGMAARDAAALKDWYVAVLDAKVVFCREGGRAPFLLSVAGGVMIELYNGDSSILETANNKLAGWRHVALRVKSLAVAKADLESRGVKFPEEPKPAGGGGTVLFFQDPEGNLLHLVERPAGSSLS
jgi:glyoxylase I family protein